MYLLLFSKFKKLHHQINFKSAQLPLILILLLTLLFLYYQFSSYQFIINGTAHLKNVNDSLNTNIYSYLGTSGGQSSNLYLKAVHFFSTRVN